MHTRKVSRDRLLRFSWFMKATKDVYTWFLKMLCPVSQYLCVCLPSRLLITNSMMWHDMDPI